MNCDNCRWFNKNGFATGFGDCVLRREVHSSNHVCKNYEEYKEVQHGEWFRGCTDHYFVNECSNCHKRYRLTIHTSKYKYCPNCGTEMGEIK